MRIDALVAERLTASPRIYDVYGLCGISLISELFLHGDVQKDIYPPDSESSDEEEDVNWEPLNVHLSTIQKLQFALQIAESVADLHGNSGGVIVHQDLKLDQLLWNEDKTMIKLNDFNRAEMMFWNDKDNEYCQYSEHEFRRVSL